MNTMVACCHVGQCSNRMATI